MKTELVTKNIADGEESFAYVKTAFDVIVAKMKQDVEQTGKHLHHLFLFAKDAFAEGNEMLILVTELTVNTSSARFISMFGCEDYHTYNEALMVTERQNTLREEIVRLTLE